MTSHRKQRAARPRPSAWWIALPAVAVLASAVAVASMMVSAQPSEGSGHLAMVRANPGVDPGLLSALRLADESGDGAGKLPPAACAPDSATMVTCLAPARGITGVVFSTYPTLRALYAAYVQRVRSLNSGQFSANHADCGRSSPGGGGEVGWNSQPQHPRTYTPAQMAAGSVTDREVAGRVFCIMTGGAHAGGAHAGGAYSGGAYSGGGQVDMVWTQDAGHLLGWVAGQPSDDVWNWWAAIHRGIAFP